MLLQHYINLSFTNVSAIAMQVEAACASNIVIVTDYSITTSLGFRDKTPTTKLHNRATATKMKFQQVTLRLVAVHSVTFEQARPPDPPPMTIRS